MGKHFKTISRERIKRMRLYINTGGKPLAQLAAALHGERQGLRDEINRLEDGA